MGIAGVYAAAGEVVILSSLLLVQWLISFLSLMYPSHYFWRMRAELHQLASPSTAPDFLRRLLEASLIPSRALHEIGLFAEFGVRGWAGILKGRGLP
jgi:hypothetical protein